MKMRMCASIIVCITVTVGVCMGLASESSKVDCSEKDCVFGITCTDALNRTCRCDKGFKHLRRSNETGTYACSSKCKGQKVGFRCRYNAICRKKDGKKKCHCQDGFQLGADAFCKDIDECRKDFCHAKADCENTDGGYNCTCQPGYSGNGTLCEDIDECDHGDGQACSANASCFNSDGGYNCTCSEGFSQNGTSCEDINECESDPDVCPLQAECTNLIGNYTCSCQVGYRRNSQACQDIDECLESGNGCDGRADCTNTNGSYTCTCPHGFLGDGVTCQDIDECVTGSNMCNSEAICMNTDGSYNCTCGENFLGNGAHCTAVVVEVRSGNDGRTGAKADNLPVIVGSSTAVAVVIICLLTVASLVILRKIKRNNLRNIEDDELDMELSSYKAAKVTGLEPLRRNKESTTATSNQHSNVDNVNENRPCVGINHWNDFEAGCGSVSRGTGKKNFEKVLKPTLSAEDLLQEKQANNPFSRITRLGSFKPPKSSGSGSKQTVGESAIYSNSTTNLGDPEYQNIRYQYLID